MSTNGRAYLTDFGIAKSIGSLTNQQTTGVNGTKLWMAPELFCYDDPEKPPRVTVASDVYALGMVFYEVSVCNSHTVLPSSIHHNTKSPEVQMFSGLTPFAGQQIGALPPSFYGKRPPKPESDTPADDRGFNHDIWRCIERCWAKEPNDRPSTQQIEKTYTDEVDPPGSNDPRPSDGDIASASSVLSLDDEHESISRSFML